MKRFNRIVRVPVTGSTNDDVAKILGEEQARGLALVAGYQERGSGRRGRAWIAPPGTALTCTLALPDPLHASALWSVPFWAALVTRRALLEAGIEPALQWPNDVLDAQGRKLGGILCISRTAGEYAWAACGIGINVVRPADETAYSGLESPPAFLNDDVEDISIDTMLAALVQAANELYGLLEQPTQLTHQWERAARIPGTRYRILPDNETQPYEAAALRLLSDGSLLVDRGGAQIPVTMADVRVLRAT
ncbi:MAG: biotin--[acetyl-CoA-carboxylase] ligase [Candidatus Baltobacteraceae bacterium]